MITTFKTGILFSERKIFRDPEQVENYSAGMAYCFAAGRVAAHFLSTASNFRI
jgi:hypothetical protein